MMVSWQQIARRSWFIVLLTLVGGSAAFSGGAGNALFAAQGEDAPPPQSAADQTAAGVAWALEETFDGDPASPSQALLPDTFEYVATHRTHPAEQFTRAYAPYPADHDQDCAGPDPAVSPLPQHMVETVQTSNSLDPDDSFFICKQHMMTALGEVGPYSVNAFWPRQAFDFSDGGTLEFEVNINLGHVERSWWEVMITPHEQLNFAAAPVGSAVDETYPAERIVFDFRRLVRTIKVGSGAVAPAGWLVNESEFGPYDYRYWNAAHPDDPALTDRRIRRTMRITLEETRITWSIEMADGSFDDYVVDVPQGLPFERGLVLFKTHAYTPHKDSNYDTYTFHWDNIRFDGPVVGEYTSHYADDVVYLQANGNRPIGDNATVNISLPEVGENPVLYGQLNNAVNGQVLLSVNGRPDVVVHPYHYDEGGCLTGQWQSWVSFRVPLDPAWLTPGNNSFKWTVGPRPACAAGTAAWDGFSVKFLQIHMAGADAPPPDGGDFGTFLPALLRRP